MQVRTTVHEFSYPLLCLVPEKKKKKKEKTNRRNEKKIFKILNV